MQPQILYEKTSFAIAKEVFINSVLKEFLGIVEPQIP